MGKENQKILVVERDKLFSEKYFEGFAKHGERDYESLILENLKIMRRGDAESDISYKQPIGYRIIVRPSDKKIFAYKRASEDKNYREKRLQGKWSWGVGGHIDSSEIEKANPIKASMEREFLEEVKLLGKIIGTKVLGYVNYDSDDVSKVHFGMLYLTEIEGNLIPNDGEISSYNFLEINELEKICGSREYDVEAWSKIALEPLKEYFNLL